MGRAEKEEAGVEQLLATITTLDPATRKELLARLSLDLKTATPDQSRDQELWATAVHEALQDALGGAAGPSGALMLVKRAVASRDAFAPVAEFMEKARLSKLPPAERLQAFRMLADMLVSQARKIARRTGAPLSPRLVANCAGNVAALFDAAFPGYLRAGLAHIVINRLTVRAN